MPARLHTFEYIIHGGKISRAHNYSGTPAPNFHGCKLAEQREGQTTKILEWHMPVTRTKTKGPSARPTGREARILPMRNETSVNKLINVLWALLRLGKRLLPLTVCNCRQDDNKGSWE